MSSFLNFRIQPLSFWLGFLLASLVWLLVARFRRQWPSIRAAGVAKLKEIRDRNLSGLETYLRQQTVDRIQKQHLAAQLFSFDEVILEPRLIAPPPAVEPHSLPPQESVLHQILPYLPDFPSLASQFNAPTLSVTEVVRPESDIVLIAESGGGKSTALAYLAAAIAKNESRSLVPLHTHVLGLDIFGDEPVDPFMVLQRLVSHSALVIYQSQVAGFLRTGLSEGKLVLIVDGLDELSPIELPKALAFFAAAKARYPRLSIVTCASPHYLSGLVEANFRPYAIAPWNRQNQTEFISAWVTAWDEHINPHLARIPGQEVVNSHLLRQWLEAASIHLSPLEMALRTWAVFAGDVYGSLPWHGLAAYAQRCLADQIPLDSISTLANHLVAQNRSYLTYSEAERFLSTLPVAPPENGSTEEGKSTKRKTQKSFAASALDTLVDCGVLSIHGGQRIAFSNPALLGFFASRCESTQPISPELILTWASASALCHYNLAQDKGFETADELVAADSAPLLRGMLHAGRFLKDMPSESYWRNEYLRAVAKLLQNGSIPFAIRARLVAILAASNDSSTSALFRQMLLSQSEATRQLAALGIGATADMKAVPDLISLLADPTPQVRYAACLALANIPSNLAQDTLSSALTEAEEDLRMVVAETYAAHPPEGHAALIEAVKSNDLMVRRVSVFALARIHEPWVYPLLEKVAIEDNQWVVRSAAAQAIESLQREASPTTTTKSPPADTAWLIEFASRQGQGVSREESPVPLLLQVLREGNLDEKQAAIDMLVAYPEPAVLDQLVELLFSTQPDLSSAADLALWNLAAAGLHLPIPAYSQYF